MAKKQPQGKRNPNDATFRNIRALKKRVAVLERDRRRDRAIMRSMLRRLNRLELK